MNSVPQGLEFLMLVGWLVDNSTYADKNTPRHMPCLQQEFKEGGTKNYVEYFSDLAFEQPDGNKAFPVSLPVMTLLVFEKNDEPMVSMFSEMWTKSARKFDKANAEKKIPYLVEFGMIANKPKSPVKAPPTKKSDKTDETTETTKQTVTTKEVAAMETSPTSTPAGPPSAQKKRKIPTLHNNVTKQEVTKQEQPWVEFVKSKQWIDKDLRPPATSWWEGEGKDNTISRSKFLHCIITFNKRMELAQWLTSKSIERVMILSNETE
jgi:hypothetical protein